MDESKYVELEAKYAAFSLPVSDFQAAMANLGGTFKTVVGLDTFFSDGKKVLRYRRARPGFPFNQSDKAELTYKQRRRNGDISDRTEVNLPLGHTATDQDVRAHLEVMGMVEHFTITKESWIQHVPADQALNPYVVQPPNYNDPYNLRGGVIGVGGMIGGGFTATTINPNRTDAVFALYDVLHEGVINRYLEVEMERVGTVSAEVAQEKLRYWKEWIGNMWPQLQGPLNTSLYEMFAPRNSLFVPESF